MKKLKELIIMLELNPNTLISIHNAFRERGLTVVAQGDRFVLPFATNIETINEIMRILRICIIIPPSETLNIHSFTVFPSPHIPSELPFGHASNEYFHNLFRTITPHRPVRSQSQNDINIGKGILKHAEGLKGKALVLTYGRATEIPFRELATQFEQVTVMDTHLEFIEEKVSHLPSELKEKIKPLVIDITGSFFSVEHQVSLLGRNPDTYDIMKLVTDILENSGNLSNKPILKEQRSYQYVVSSMVTSQATSLPLNMVGKLISKKYPHIHFPELNGKIKNKLLAKVCTQLMCDHINFVVDCCAKGGSIYWVDHTAAALTYSEGGQIKEKPPIEAIQMDKYSMLLTPHFGQIKPGEKWDWDTRPAAVAFAYDRGDIIPTNERAGSRMKMQEYLFSDRKIVCMDPNCKKHH